MIVVMFLFIVNLGWLGWFSFMLAGLWLFVIGALTGDV